MEGSSGQQEPAQAQAGYYNPRPRPREPRVEVEEVLDVSGSVSVRTRVVLETEGASSLSSVFTLCNTALGAGVLGLPYAFVCAGLVGCLLLFLAVAALEAFTMYVLAKFAERYDAPSYGTLVRRALGRKTASVLSGVMVLYLWGSSLAYLVVVADTFTSLSSMLLGPGAWTSQRVPLLAVLGTVLLPLCFPRKLSAMEWVSAASVVGFLYTSVAISVRGIQAVAARPEPFKDVQMLNLNEHALYAVSLVVFGFNCHANVIACFWELDHRPHRLISALPESPEGFHSLGRLAPRPYTHKLVGMLGAILLYMVIIFGGYFLVGVTGYLAYPTSASSNILNTFPSDDPVIQIARAAIGGVCFGSYPLNHHPARLAWEDLIAALANVNAMPLWLSRLMTAVFVSSTVAAAMWVSDLGSVLHVVGGLAASFLVFTLPGLLLMNAAVIKHAPVRGSRTTLAEAAARAADVDAASAGAVATSPSAAGAASGSQDPDLSAPLLPDVALLTKKAGFREAGFVFANQSKSWWAGAALVVISGGVMVVTLATS